MATEAVNQNLIDKISRGDEKAFECLYNSYFVYLCTCANSYIFNPIEAQDIVNEVFIKIWNRREDLCFPIHSYLIRSIQNSSLNYLRSLHSREAVIDEYREALLQFQEEYCAANSNPLSDLERTDLENQVATVVSSLPNKCRYVFEQYLYSGLTPQEIADKNDISVNTVRVHIKTAMDRIRQKLGNGAGILLLYLF